MAAIDSAMDRVKARSAPAPAPAPERREGVCLAQPPAQTRACAGALGTAPQRGRRAGRPVERGFGPLQAFLDKHLA
jgi:hypothetical protein